MKAFVKLEEDNTELACQEVAEPVPAAGELLVEVRAIGVGIHDEYFLPADPQYPYVIGIEGAGVIKEVVSPDSAYKPGQRIMFVNAMQEKGGTWAEFTVLAESSLILPIPEDMTYEQAAALPVAGNTVLRALSALSQVSGDQLFIAGGSGAIGSLAIQIAVARGYTVVASASPQNHDYMRSLGASQVVDYHDSNWQDQVREWFPNGVAAAIAIQPGTASECQAVVKDEGTIVTVSGDQLVPERGIFLQQIPHDADVRDELLDLLTQINNGKMQMSIEKTYHFADALTALEKVKTRHTRGKLVLTLAQPL